MNVADERSRSYWMETAPRIEAPPLTQDAECDDLVVGSGIAGLSAAYELSKAGRKVMVIDRGAIGSGMTARTTAHIVTENDDRYAELIRVRGEEEAKLYHASQVEALDRIEAIVGEQGIDCDFARLDAFLFTAEPKHREQLEEEFDACTRLGVPVAWADRAPVPGKNTGKALKFPGQGRFHPTRYLAGLAAAIRAGGGRLHADTAYVDGEEKDGLVAIETDRGHCIRAASAVFATNSPVTNKFVVHEKQVPVRSYVIAGPVARGEVEDALVWDTWQKRDGDEFYHYVRLQPLDDGRDLLIAGGEDHRSGEADDMDARLARLEQWTRKHYPAFGDISHRWSGQLLETVDFMPYSGRNPGSDNIYIHTGDSGIGIANGVAGALNISRLIRGEPSRFADLLDAGRPIPGALPSLRAFFTAQVGAARNLADYVMPGDIASADQLQPGEGAVVREGIKKIAAYRRDDGTLVRHSAVCTHMACHVQWNPFEGCWDCPCHGSQFAAEGQVLNGPAISPLGEAW
ncbi:MAG: FAD-dependent oxidoreductase [Sphingosinicella sp.]